MAKCVDMLGQKHGTWTVLARTGSRDQGNSRAAKWLARCDCGREQIVEGSTLRLGKSRTCRSCAKHIRPYEALYNLLRSNAERRGYEVMPYEDFLVFVTAKECHYCGASVAWAEHDVYKNSQGYHLDRVDSAKGYTGANCVVCCWSCNITKSDKLSYEEMVVVGSMRRRDGNQLPLFVHPKTRQLHSTFRQFTPPTS
jgi:hypothetical protein